MKEKLNTYLWHSVPYIFSTHAANGKRFLYCVSDTVNTATMPFLVVREVDRWNVAHSRAGTWTRATRQSSHPVLTAWTDRQQKCGALIGAGSGESGR
jgi:hypothetical protein